MTGPVVAFRSCHHGTTDVQENGLVDISGLGGLIRGWPRVRRPLAEFNELRGRKRCTLLQHDLGDGW